MPYFFIVLFIVFLMVKATIQYQLPDTTVEAYYPKGFAVSIPNENGIKLFAFHGNINEDMTRKLSAGMFSGEVNETKNGKWIFIDNSTKVNIGDTFYFWTLVNYFDGERELSYAKVDQFFTIKELLPQPGSTPDPNVCLFTKTTVNGKKTCWGHLIFDSNFDQLDRENDKYWTIQRKFAWTPDFEFVIYDDNATLSVTNGHLIIKPTLLENVSGNNSVTNAFDFGDRCSASNHSSIECSQRSFGGFIIPPVLSSQLVTKGKFSFKYGRIEVKAKLPKGDWLYPELFLNPEKEIYGPNYESGQIRIAYSIGNDLFNRKLEGGAILGTTPAARKYAIKMLEQSTPWADQFHTYAVLWEPDRITVSIDGMVYGLIKAPEKGFSSLANNLKIPHANKWKSNFAPFDEEMHIVVGIGAGGHNIEDRSDGSKPWENMNFRSQRDFYKAKSSWFPSWGEDSKLDVEYIKVWAL